MPGVTIRTTSHGIPHIKAKDFYGAAYGYGYAFAQDNLCEMAETYATVSGELVRDHHDLHVRGQHSAPGKAIRGLIEHASDRSGRDIETALGEPEKGESRLRF